MSSLPLALLLHPPVSQTGEPCKDNGTCVEGDTPHSSQDGSGRSSLTARDLFSRVVPLIRWEGEIREVAVTALGLVHPPAFGFVLIDFIGVRQLCDAFHAVT